MSRSPGELSERLDVTSRGWVEAKHYSINNSCTMVTIILCLLSPALKPTASFQKVSNELSRGGKLEENPNFIALLLKVEQWHYRADHWTLAWDIWYNYCVCQCSLNTQAAAGVTTAPWGFTKLSSQLSLFTSPSTPLPMGLNSHPCPWRQQEFKLPSSSICKTGTWMGWI